MRSALVATVGLLACVAVARAADPPGTTRSPDRPWLIECAQASCMTRTRSALSMLQRRSFSINLFSRPFGMSLQDAQAFSPYMERWPVALAATNELARRKICDRLTEVTTYPELATALAELEAATHGLVDRYIAALRDSLSSRGAALVDEAIDEGLRSGGWSSIDGAMYDEMNGVSPSQHMETLCVRPAPELDYRREPPA